MHDFTENPNAVISNLTLQEVSLKEIMTYLLVDSMSHDWVQLRTELGPNPVR